MASAAASRPNDGDSPNSDVEDNKNTVRVISRTMWGSLGQTGEYTGEVLESTGVPQGSGRMEYKWNHTGIDDLRGEVLSYDGNWSNGNWDGYGQAIYRDGCCRQGEYTSGILEGNDCTIEMGGQGTFRGRVVNGTATTGKYTFPDGGHAVTVWENGRFKDGYASGLPNGWEVVFSDIGGLHYMNTKNGTVQWERPPVVYANATAGFSYADDATNPFLKTMARLRRSVLLAGVRDIREDPFWVLATAALYAVAVRQLWRMPKLAPALLSSSRRFLCDVWYGAIHLPGKCFEAVASFLAPFGARSGASTATAAAAAAVEGATTAAATTTTPGMFPVILLFLVLANNLLPNAGGSNNEISIPAIVVETVLAFVFLVHLMIEASFLLLIKMPAMLALEATFRTGRLFERFGNPSWLRKAEVWYLKAKISTSRWNCHVTEDSLINVSPLHLVLLGPLREELQFRYFFDKLWHGVSGLLARMMTKLGWLEVTKTALATAATATTVTSSRSSPLWVYFNSVCFGLMHASNWVTYDPQKRAIAASGKIFPNPRDALRTAFMQAASASAMAFFFLNPLYLERGLAASFGAHASWNGFLALLLSKMSKEGILADLREEEDPYLSKSLLGSKERG